jgi:hypothetical protein
MNPCFEDLSNQIHKQCSHQVQCLFNFFLSFTVPWFHLFFLYFICYLPSQQVPIYVKLYIPT